MPGDGVITGYGRIEGRVGASLDDLRVTGQKAGGRRLQLVDANQQDRVAFVGARCGLKSPRGNQSRR